MREITLICEEREYKTVSSVFSGGELQVKIPGFDRCPDGELLIMARLQGPFDIIRLVLAAEIIERLHEGQRCLYIPYFPYARQDRVTIETEAFSLKPIAEIINSLIFEKVITNDAHSDVTPALVNRLMPIEQVEIIAEHRALTFLCQAGDITIVAPDAGAMKKAIKVAKLFKAPLICAQKIRDVETGDILHTDINIGDKKRFLIVDDICDGGKTFIELAKLMRQQGAEKIFLYVTHGIFSRGLEPFKGLIDRIYTTNSFLSPITDSSNNDNPVPLFVCNVNFYQGVNNEK